ncbi:MAG: thioredoxin family protein [Novosphingobium sp.]
MSLLRGLPAVLALLAAQPAQAAEPEPAAYYPERADDAARLDAALAAARAEGKLAVIVFGADWCHDSQSLARLLTSDAFMTDFGERFTVLFIDVGVPQDGRGRNLDLAARFGVAKMPGTPAMVVVSPRGKRLNGRQDAYSWRNAASRDRAEVLGWFRRIAAKE